MEATLPLINPRKRLLKMLKDAFKEATEYDVIRWVNEFHQIAKVSGSEYGQYSTKRTPYLVEIFRALADPKINEVYVLKASQLGLSELAIAFINYLIDINPCNIFYILPTLDSARKFSTIRFDPSIKINKKLKGKITASSMGGKKTDNLLSKSFLNGILNIICSNSTSSLRALPCEFATCDEMDEYPEDAGDQGDVISILKGRFNAQKTYKIYGPCTPTVEGISKIDKIFKEETDQRRYYLPCPSCQNEDHLKLENFKWKNDDPDTVVWECPKCKSEFNERVFKSYHGGVGKWKATAKIKNKGRVVGFHINSFYAPLGWVSWPRIIKEYLDAERSEVKMKAFWNLFLGLAWPLKGLKVPDWEVLYKRREDYPKNILLPGYNLIFASVDCQCDRLEVLLTSYKTDGSFATASVDRRVFYGDVTNINDKCYKQVEEILTEEFPIKDSSYVTTVEALGFDASYNTQNIYNWHKKLKSKNRKLASKVFLLMGRDNLDTPIGQIKKVDMKDAKTQKRKGSARVHYVGVSILKSELYGWLNREWKKAEPMPYGWARFPKAYDKDFFQQLTAEKLVQKGNKFNWVKKDESDSNEILDLYIYARALYEIKGFSDYNKMKWDSYNSKFGVHTKPVKKKQPESDYWRGYNEKLKLW